MEEEDEDDGEDRGRTAPRNASQPRSRSVGPMAAPDEPEAESADDREAYKSSGVSTAWRDLDQIPRSQRLQKRQKSPIGLSLVQLEEIGLLDYDEDERPRSDDAADAAPESAAPAAPEPPCGWRPRGRRTSRATRRERVQWPLVELVKPRGGSSGGMQWAKGTWEGSGGGGASPRRRRGSIGTGAGESRAVGGAGEGKDGGSSAPRDGG